MDVGVALVYIAFIVLVIATLVLSKWYGPERARELLLLVRDATKEVAESIRESAKAVVEIHRLATEERKRREGGE